MSDIFFDPPPTYYDDEERFGTGGEMIAEIKRLRLRIAELEKGYKDAIEEIGAWGAYASSYFQDKHDLEGVISEHRGILNRKVE